MRDKFLCHKGWSAALATALICAVTLTAKGVASDKRSGGSAVDIEHFGKVNDHFYRGAQPAGGNYDQLAALGVKTIVDLRQDAKNDARSNAERVGMRYINLPMKEKTYPKPDAAARFLEIINDQANWPVYVHCAGGRHRTGVMTAVYRMSVDGWNIEQSYREMMQYGFYTGWGHGCYKDYVYDYYRDLQAHHQRQRLEGDE